jgi:hypothetical protein
MDIEKVIMIHEGRISRLEGVFKVVVALGVAQVAGLGALIVLVVERLH